MYIGTYLEVRGHIHAPSALPKAKEHPASIEQEAGWAPEPVWTMWRGENLAATVIRTPASRQFSPQS
jgi:hypothetical protein